MAKSSTQYLCSECGWSGGKWFGRCPECGQWGTVEEFHEARPSSRTRAAKITVTENGVVTAGGRASRGISTAGNGSSNGSARAGSTRAAGGIGGNDISAGGIGTVRTSRTEAVYVPDSLITPITEVADHNVDRIGTGFEEFDRVLGGGIVPGSVVLVAGEPGIGKSTLLLETAGRVAKSIGDASVSANVDTNVNDTDPTVSSTANTSTTANTANTPTTDLTGKVLYISGEESTAQVRMRAGRIGAVNENLLLSSTTDLATVLGLLEQVNPRLAIVDSAQTITSQDVDGIAGGSTQVREVASALIDVAKSRGIPVLLVGHVTKDGSIAGPRTLEHLVDVVCQFEGDPQTALRMLRAVKNRFGPTDEVGCFDMSGEGIDEVTNPGALFLSDADDTGGNSGNGGNSSANTEGTCVTFTVDGHRSLPIEVQALVTNSVLPTPRRATNGIDSNRLAMLVAVLYRHGKVPLLTNDLYISTIAGGLAKEPSCDLAVAAALASAAFHAPIPRDWAAIGEISLTGQVRPVPRLEYRLREAARLGFTHVVVPKHRRGAKPISVDGITVIEVDSLPRALRALGVERK